MKPAPPLISIHLMLMLIIHNKLENRRKKAISIHLMLMLIADAVEYWLVDVPFQYISC